MKKLQIITIVTVVLAMLGGALVLLIPVPAGELPLRFYSWFVISAMISTLQVGATMALMLSLRNFSAELKKAYTFMAAGFILLGVSLLQFPLISAFGLTETILLKGGIVVLPFFLTALLIYLGFRKFAKIMDIKTHWNSVILSLMAAFIVGGIVYFLPHAEIASTEIEFRSAMSLSAVDATLWLIAVWLAYRVKRRASPLYAPAFGLILYTMVVMVISVLSYLVISLTIAEESVVLDAGGPFLVYYISGILLFKAAFEFYKIGSTDELTLVNIAGEKPVTSDQPQDVIDVVTYFAQFASNPRTIDPILDRLRFITSSLKAGQSLSEDQQSTLAAIYVDLEKYLIEQEPVRKFTKEEIREILHERFAATKNINQTFWNRLSSQT